MSWVATCSTTARALRKRVAKAPAVAVHLLPRYTHAHVAVRHVACRTQRYRYFSRSLTAVSSGTDASTRSLSSASVRGCGWGTGFQEAVE